MKNKYSLVIALAVALVAVVAALAQSRTSGGKMYVLKSGEVIAELHVLGAAQASLKASGSSGRVEYDPSAGTMNGTGGVRLTLTIGTNSVSVESDEIEMLPVIDDRIMRR